MIQTFAFPTNLSLTSLLGTSKTFFSRIILRPVRFVCFSQLRSDVCCVDIFFLRPVSNLLLNPFRIAIKEGSLFPANLMLWIVYLECKKHVNARLSENNIPCSKRVTDRMARFPVAFKTQILAGFCIESCPVVVCLGFCLFWLLF